MGVLSSQSILNSSACLSLIDIKPAKPDQAIAVPCCINFGALGTISFCSLSTIYLVAVEDFFGQNYREEVHAVRSSLIESEEEAAKDERSASMYIVFMWCLLVSLADVQSIF